MSEFVLGIDLGTTNSCAAVHLEGQTEVLPDPNGFTTLPSLVYVSAGDNFVVGRDAVEYLATHPAQTIFGAKRLMGRQPDPEEIERIQQYFPYEVALGDNGELVVAAGGKTLGLVDISATILTHVRDNARDYLGTDVRKAVISCPAYFTQPQREAVRKAGEQAGLDVLRIINEPTAAALAFRAGDYDAEKILVYDLGGGTFDVTVLQLREKVYEVLSTGGDSFLGGLDFDKAIRDTFRERFESESGASLEDDPGALQRLMSAAEAAKIGVGMHEDHTVDVPYLTKTKDKLPKRLGFKTTVTRQEIDEICQDLIEQTLIIADEVLIEAGLNAADIGEVVLVGGMTRFQPVRDRVARHFQTEPHTDLNPDEVVAIGAAILADAMVNESDVLELVDVVPVSIGCTINHGPYDTVIHRNTRVPTTIEQVVPTNVDNQTGLLVRVYQGESANPADNVMLGELTVEGIPPRPAGEIEVQLEYGLDAESLLSITARETQTGQELVTQFSTDSTVEVARLQRELADTPPATADAEPAADPAATEPAAPDPVADAASTPEPEPEAVSEPETSEPTSVATTEFSAEPEQDAAAPTDPVAEPSAEPQLGEPGEVFDLGAAADDFTEPETQPEPAADAPIESAELVSEPETTEPSEPERIETAGAQAQALLTEIKAIATTAGQRYQEVVEQAQGQTSNDDVAQALESAEAANTDVASAAQEAETICADMEFVATAAEAETLLERLQNCRSREEKAAEQSGNACNRLEQLVVGAKAQEETQAHLENERRLADIQEQVKQKTSQLQRILQDIENKKVLLTPASPEFALPAEVQADVQQWQTSLQTCKAHVDEALTAAENAMQSDQAPAAEAAARQVDFVASEFNTLAEQLQADADSLADQVAQAQTAARVAAAQSVVQEKIQNALQPLQTRYQTFVPQAKAIADKLDGLPAETETLPEGLRSGVDSSLQDAKQAYATLEAQMETASAALEQLAAATAENDIPELQDAADTAITSATDQLTRADEALSATDQLLREQREQASRQAEIDKWMKTATASSNAAVEAAAKTSAMVEQLAETIQKHAAKGADVQETLDQARQAAARADVASGLAREASVAAQQADKAPAAEAAARQAASAQNMAEEERNKVVALLDSGMQAAKNEADARASAPPAAPDHADSQKTAPSPPIAAIEQTDESPSQDEVGDFSELFGDQDTPVGSEPHADASATGEGSVETEVIEDDDDSDVFTLESDTEPEAPQTEGNGAALGRVQLVSKPVDPEFEAQAPAPTEETKYRDLSELFTVSDGSDVDASPSQASEKPALEIFDDSTDTAVETVVVDNDQSDDAMDLTSSASTDDDTLLNVANAVTETHATDEQPLQDEAVGKHLLHHQLINEDQLTEAIAYCDKHNHSFQAYALEHGHLSKTDIQNAEREQTFLDKNYDYKSFDETVVYMGLVTQELADEINSARARINTTIGDALVKLGHLEASTLENELKALHKKKHKKQAELVLPDGLKKPALVKIFVTIASRCFNELVEVSTTPTNARDLSDDAELDYVTVAINVAGDLNAKFALTFDYDASYIVATEMNPALGMIDDIQYDHISDEVVQFCRKVAEQCVEHIKSKSSFGIRTEDPANVTDQLELNGKVGVQIDFGNNSGGVRFIWIE